MLIRVFYGAKKNVRGGGWLAVLSVYESPHPERTLLKEIHPTRDEAHEAAKAFWEDFRKTYRPGELGKTPAVGGESAR